MVGREVVDHLCGARGAVRAVHGRLLRDESLHEIRIGIVAALLDLVFVRVVRAIDLHIAATDPMIGVISGHISGDRSSTRRGGISVLEMQRIAIGTIQHAVNALVVGQPAEEGVERPVLREDDNIFDALLPELSWRCCGACCKDPPQSSAMIWKFTASEVDRIGSIYGFGS